MIHAENADKYINDIIEALPNYMEDEKKVLALARDSILNHIVWAYSNKPYNKYDASKFNAVSLILNKNNT